MDVTPTRKRAIDHSYKELAASFEKKVTHETAVRSAFQNLLATFAQSVVLGNVRRKWADSG
jgi:hypothetical protein